MNIGARAYGEALWQLSIEDNCTEEMYEAGGIIYKALKQVPDYIQILKTPLISRQEKKKALQKWLFWTPELLQNTAYLLCDKNKPYLLFDVFLVYRALYLESKNMISATVISAVPLSDEDLIKVKQTLEEKTNQIIDLENEVDPSCLGGLKVMMQDKQYDATLETQLEKIHSMLLEAKGEL